MSDKSLHDVVLEGFALVRRRFDEQNAKTDQRIRERELQIAELRGLVSALRSNNSETTSWPAGEARPECESASTLDPTSRWH